MFQLQNLFYWNDVNFSYETLKEFSKLYKVELDDIFKKGYILPSFDSVDSTSPLYPILNSEMGNVHIIMGLSALFKHKSTKLAVSSFIQTNFK